MTKSYDVFDKVSFEKQQVIPGRNPGSSINLSLKTGVGSGNILPS